MHLFHNWMYYNKDHRFCKKCNRKESYSAELGGWFDTGYLEGTNYDNMRHVKESFHD